MRALAVVVCLAITSTLAAEDRYGFSGSNSSTTASTPPAASPFAGSASFATEPASATYSSSSSSSTTPISPSSSTYQPSATTRQPYRSSASTTTSNSRALAQPPASYTAPLSSVEDYTRAATTSSDASVKPSDMISAMLTAPRESRLTGYRVSLADVISTATTRREQTQRIEAYWDLCSSVADYYLGLREQSELGRLRTMTSTVGSTWQQAEAELGVRVSTAQRAAVASQHHLANLMGTSNLPLPGDMPHCGDYYSRYEQVFSNRQSAEAAQLKELLPLRYEELKVATLAVTRAEEWMDMVAKNSSSQSDATGMLRALELLALRRRAFVQIARDYNRRIARYAELAAPGDIASRQLVAMLIFDDSQPRSATRTNPASQPPAYQSSMNEAEPRTFSDDWEASGTNEWEGVTIDENVQPASAEMPDRTETFRQERSLLVTPRQ